MEVIFLNYAGYEGFRLTHELDTNKSKSETIYKSRRKYYFPHDLFHIFQTVAFLCGKTISERVLPS